MKDIKKTYHDALFFASSPSNKKENFYLTPSEFKVLIKLMMYQRNNSDITYQNKTIAEHIFLAESTVKDAMEALARMAYISTELDVFNNGLGFKSKRTVRINWKRIQEIDNKISTENEAPESKITTQPIPEVQVEEKVAVIKDNEIFNDKEGMRVKFTDDRKYYKESQISPADFHSLTDNIFFNKLPFKNFIGLKSNDFEGFWNRVKELELQLENQNELVS
jgi:hypothetical protein